ncbi:YqxA family protein [Mesobacillus foraminis]|uniref:YqxA family protein n=1 Tax=Mesobacillus foraminis TaxID=279826 RepID=UPI00288AC089|nr:YqxA family protein [Mesobacillus foraminis]
MNMKLFMLKGVLLASLVFISVLAGMQLANNGMEKMRGYEDPDFKSAFTIQENSDGNVETAILGNDLSSHDLEQKRKTLEEMKAFNFFSNIGKKLANGLTEMAEKSLELITNKEKQE